jgi:hypothetical protein
MNIDQANKAIANCRDSAMAWFGDVRVLVCGEYVPVERDTEGCFEVQMVLVGDTDIASGLTGDQIKLLSDQAYWTCQQRGRP